MEQIRAIFTVRPLILSPAPLLSCAGSLVIRAANPVSFMRIAPASHMITVDGDYGIEASMEHGVRRAPLTEMMAGLKPVCDRTYDVKDAEAGLAWGRETAARHAPYDWRGAFALGLAPDRQWQEDDDWFCFELGANIITLAGRDTFADHAHVTAYMLMMLAQ